MIKNMASKFTEEELEQIGNYLAEKYPVLKSGPDLFRYSDIKIDIYERIVRVEEELKHQRELIHEVLKMMDKRFEEMRIDMDKRFEQVDKRFEQIDKRFEDMRTDMNSRFEQVDKRFEDMRTDMNSRFEEMRTDMDRRFDQVDKRFTMMMWFTGIGFTLITTIITGAFVLIK